MTIYETGTEYLLDELRRIDMIIRCHYLKWKKEHHEDPDGFQGLYISDNEISSILKTDPFTLNLCPDSELEKIDAMTEEIGIKKLRTLREGRRLRFHTLCELFRLKPFESDTLLVCLAPELDLRYEKLYAYLQNDVTRKRPTVDLVTGFLCSSHEDKIKSREYFLQTSSLIRNHILTFIGDDQLPLLSRSLKIDERIISFLLEGDGIDHRIQNFVSILKPEKTFSEIITSVDFKNRLMEFTELFSNSCIFYFSGSRGTGRKTAAEVICSELRTNLLVVDSKGLKGNGYIEKLNLIIREAVLHNSSIFFENFDMLFEKETGIDIQSVMRHIDGFSGTTFLSGETAFEPGGGLNHSFIKLEFPIPSFDLRKQMWKSFLHGKAEDADLDALAGKFKFSAGRIKDAISSARNYCIGRGTLFMSDLYLGCRAQSAGSMSALARKIQPKYMWNDIVLPLDTKDQLKEVAGHIKYRAVVFSDWGFDRNLSAGKGLNILFSGPSGTGKTMAAEIIACETQLDIYRIDLSNIVSKYIGETEKNLSRIFKEAETSNAILFFDEADALFGKRSEVKDAHDRYANIEISYLLQKMEEYDGVVILATNLSKNIDDAFLRRMQIVIEFPFPDEKQRKLIWMRIFPHESPLSDDIDYKFLSEKIKLAGGNIKNMALAAAFYAAENSGQINMHHIMHAVKREYQKVGKPFLKSDFDPYYKLIEAR